MHLAEAGGGVLHGPHRVLIGALHGGHGGGSLNSLDTGLIRLLHAALQAVLHRFQVGQRGGLGGGHSLLAVGGHGLILRLGDHLHLERDGAAIDHIIRNNVLRQIVAVIRRLHVVGRDQCLRLHQIPRLAAVHRPHGPVFRVCGVQIVADERVVTRLGRAERRRRPHGVGNSAVHIGRHHPFDVGPTKVGVAVVGLPGHLAFVNVDLQRHLCRGL